MKEFLFKKSLCEYLKFQTKRLSLSANPLLNFRKRNGASENECLSLLVFYSQLFRYWGNPPRP